MNEIAAVSTVPATQGFPFEREIMEWDVEAAVARIRPKVEAFHRVAEDLAKDLYIAHEALARRGGDRRSEDAPEYTWSDFCAAVGISRKTAMLYMRLYDPAEDRVRSPEEIQAARPPALAEDPDKFERLVTHAVETGERLYNEGWSDAHEREFRRRAENRHFAEMARKWGSRKIKLNWRGRDYFSEAMQNARQYARFSLETKEQTLAQFELFEQLAAYLKSFGDPGTRLAAAYNIGLRVRDVVNEMASRTAEIDSCKPEEA
ncbi:MAG: hypothetical protein K2H09_07050 [Treponemataceae bacterium]|nr:hypothetical protein [Treponemataceae bacterium]